MYQPTRIIIITLACLLLCGVSLSTGCRKPSKQPAQAQEPASGTAPGSERFTATGQLLLPGGSIPAAWHYDYPQRRVWIDMQLAAGQHTWGLLDWSGATPTGYLGGPERCFHFAISQTEMPAPMLLHRSFESPASDAATMTLDQMPKGLSVLGDSTTESNLLLVREEEAVVVFEVETRTSFQASSSLATFDRDLSKCDSMQDIVDALRSNRPGDAADATGRPLLQYNHEYTFRGLFYGGLKYQGNVFSQDKPQYDAALKACEDAGAATCKPYYETGGVFGRYGYRCGDGWGSGSTSVSGQDYCCLLHDNKAWDSSGSAGEVANNLCGLAACMTCKHYSSLGDWEQSFRGDFWANKAIVAWVAAGLIGIVCHPRSPVSGFTCN